MAKKKEELSLEEKLEKALVPDWEQPYKVPSNWVWVKLGCLAKNMADGPFGSNLKREHYTEKKEVRIIQLSNIGEEGWKNENIKYTTYEHAKTISRSVVDPGNIVIAKMMPAGRAIIVPNEETMYILSSDAVKLVPHDVVLAEYFVLGINCSFFRNQVQENTQGITRARTSISKLKTYAFVLPPLAEQKRIVERIESLFSKLDEAKELAQSALDSFENRKSAVLHKAFTGELTKKWRAEKGISYDSWEEKNLKDVLDVRDGTHDSPTYQECGYPLITSKNLKNDVINYNNIKYISEADYDSINLRSQVEVNDILFAMIGTIGNPVVVINKPDFAIKNVALFKDIGKVNPHFVKYYLETQYVKGKMKKEAKGSTQKFVSLGYLRTFPIITPSLQEQKEIVRILGSIFEREIKAKERVNLIEQIDLMKKAILARAFRGELGTNDKNDEKAIRLLKEILSEESVEVKKKEKKVRLIPKSISKQFKTDLEEQIYRYILENQNATLNQVLSSISSSKHLDAMEVITVLNQKNLINEKRGFYFTV